jgi:hypothetical protein
VNAYRVTFKAGSISNDSALVLADDIVAAAKKAERIRKELDYFDVIKIDLEGEITEQ